MRTKTRKGFIDIIAVIAIAAFAIGGFAYFGTRQSTKLEKVREEIQQAQTQLGATIATTSLSDTIGTFRTNVNSSLENINTQLNSVSSTVSNLGTIATENSPLAVNKGGTGTTTSPLDLQYFGRNGATTGYLNLVASSGISIATTTTSTIFSTQGFDASASFNFTGSNTHASTTFTASTTFSSTANVRNNASTTFSATTTFSGYVAGTIDKINITTATSTVIASSTTSSTLVSVSIPANTLGTNDGVEIQVFYSNITASSTATGLHISADYGGQEFGRTVPVITAATSPFTGMSTIAIYANSSANSQKAIMFSNFNNGNPGNEAATTSTQSYFSKVLSVDSTAAQTFNLWAKWDQINNSSTISVDAITLKRIR